MNPTVTWTTSAQTVTGAFALAALLAVTGAATCGAPASHPAVSVPRVLGVRAVLSVAGLAGTVVRVSGRCAVGSAIAGVGTPPVSARDWLLDADGVAVFVTGPLPTRCGGGSGGSRVPEGDSITILARVAEDTLPELAGSMPRAPRRYLVRLDRDEGGGEQEE